MTRASENLLTVFHLLPPAEHGVQSEFNKQKLALRKPGVGRVGDDGRCVPAASLSRKTRRTPITTTTQSFVVPPGMASRPPPFPVSSESLLSQRRSPPENAPRVEASARANDGVLASTTGDENKGGGVDDLAGTTVDGGWIVRAVVLEKDYGVFGAGVGGGGGGNSVSPYDYYLVEVEALGGSRGGGSEAEGGGAWACYKR